MRVAGIVVALTLQVAVLAARPASASTEGYSGTYLGESSYTTLLPGAVSRFVVAYLNDGTTTWEPDVVGLVVCAADGTTCGNGAVAPVSETDWYAPNAYATVDRAVAPGEVAFFLIAVGVPGDTSPGSTLAFAGDVGLVATGAVFGDSAFREQVSVPAPGIAERLTISGVDTPKTVGEALTMAVDVDDANVELVGGDQTTVVTAALDPATCAGAPGGPVTLGSLASTAADGRAWFVFHSLGAYAGCRVGVSAPGLVANATTIAFVAAAPARLDCRFSPGVVTQDAFASAAVDVRDAYGNRVLPASPFTIALSRTAGAATALVTTDPQATRLGAAFFTVRGLSIGRDTYHASADGSPVAPSDCSIGVIAG